MSINYRNTHTLILMPSGRREQVEDGQTVMDAARKVGVEIESLCGGRQSCHKCRVIVEEGHFDKHAISSSSKHLSSPTNNEITLLKKLGTPEQRLSCDAQIHGDLLITIPESSQAKKQIIRKKVTNRDVVIDPVIKQYYVTVRDAQLGVHRGDWGRLQDALETQWDLVDLSIDIHALRKLQVALRTENWSVTAIVWNNREVIDVQPGHKDSMYGLAVDVGSTTVAGYLCDLQSGNILATEALMNPQVSYGEDLMSRISFVINRADGLHLMNTAIIDSINELANRTAKLARIHPRRIHDIVLVGNTTMTHIFLGINPREIGGAPFALANRDAIDIKARDLGLRLNPGAYAHVLPSQAGHVGADNVAVLVAEQPQCLDSIILTVDIGTNAEIVLTSSKWMFSASSPTGPAFEGGQITSGMRAAPGAIERVRIDPKTKLPRFRVIGESCWSDQWQHRDNECADTKPSHLASGICGSGIIEAVAELFLAGILFPDGKFNPDIDCNAMYWDQEKRKGAYILATEDQSFSGNPILITQQDIRNIQLAKAALYAGAKLLMMRAKVEHLDQVILAGAFGSYIDPKHAMVLGLIPDCKIENVHAVGNAAGDGARIALLNRQKRAHAQDIAEQISYIETALDPDFQTEFVSAMHLPHQYDSFHNLGGILENSAVVTKVPRRTRRRRRTANN